MISSTPRAFGRLLTECQLGQGEIQPKSGADLPELRQLAVALGAHAITDTVTFLSPKETLLQHALIEPPMPGDFYRDVLGHRVFNLRLDDNIECGNFDVGTVSIKGGDLPHAKNIPFYSYDAMWARLKAHEIPGGGFVDSLRAEQAAAYELHEHSLATHGLLAPTALPLSVRLMSHMPSEKGQQSIRSYLNSGEYHEANLLSGEERATLAQSDRIRIAKFGDYLLRNPNPDLLPAQYWYAIPGLNIRVSSIKQATFGARPDIINEYTRYRPGEVTHAIVDGKSPIELKNIFIRNTYTMLDAAYGTELVDLLPAKDPKNNTTFYENQHTFLRTSRRKGIDRIIINAFIDRLTQTAALAHSLESTFAGAEGLRSSLHPGNVTVNGTTLDLDTYATWTGPSGEDVRRDFTDICLGVEIMHSLVSDTVIDTAALVKQRYREHHRIIGTEKPLIRQLSATFDIHGK